MILIIIYLIFLHLLILQMCLPAASHIPAFPICHVFRTAQAGTSAAWISDRFHLGVVSRPSQISSESSLHLEWAEARTCLYSHIYLV